MQLEHLDYACRVSWHDPHGDFHQEVYVDRTPSLAKLPAVDRWREIVLKPAYSQVTLDEGKIEWERKL